MEPLVSIIIPVYNSEKYLGKCIESIRNQSYKNIEILIINDGSKDRSEELIFSHMDQEPRIRYQKQNNKGVAIARNKGVEHAIGKYLLFVDSDDYLSVDYVKELVTCAEKYDSDLTISGYTLFYQKNGKKIETIPLAYKAHEKEEWAYRISATWGHLYKMEFWQKHCLKFMQEENARAEDVPIVLYANAMAQNICVCPNSDYYYRQHESSAMNDRTKKVKFCFPYQAFEIMFERVKEAECTNSRAFFGFGVLKFLAQFDFVLYRHADQDEKRNYREYKHRLIGNDFDEMVLGWKRLKKNMDLPLVHKIAIDMFVMKFKIERSRMKGDMT